MCEMPKLDRDEDGSPFYSVRLEDVRSLRDCLKRAGVEVELMDEDDLRRARSNDCEVFVTVVIAENDLAAAENAIREWTPPTLS